MIINPYTYSPAADLSFRFSIDTSLGDGISQYQLPLKVGGNYNFLLEDGLGNSWTITSWNQAETLIDYTSNPGVNQISITGLCTSWHTNNTGDKLKPLGIDNIGVVGFTDVIAGWFGCSNLTYVSDDNLEAFTGCSSFQLTFQSCNLTTLPLFNTSSILFWNNFIVFNPNFNYIPAWDTSNGTNFDSAFRGLGNINCEALNFETMTNGFNMFLHTTIATTDYDSILTLNAGLTVQSGINATFGFSKYSVAALPDRNILTDPPNNWNLTDGGQA